jgi:hypothetical protein
MLVHISGTSARTVLWNVWVGSSTLATFILHSVRRRAMWAVEIARKVFTLSGASVVCLLYKRTQLGWLSRYINGLRPGIAFSAGAWHFILLHSVQTYTGAHPASFPMGSGGPFPGGGDASGARSWLLASSKAEVKNVGAVLPPPPIHLHGVVFN